MICEMNVDMLLCNLSKKHTVEYKDIKLCIQDYLHYINSVKNSNNNKTIEKIFSYEPQYYENIPKNVYAYIAGIVEKVSKDCNLNTPKWIFKNDYYLKEPWFPPEIERFNEIKQILKKVSPKAFKARNIFVSEQAISVS